MQIKFNTQDWVLKDLELLSHILGFNLRQPGGFVINPLNQAQLEEFSTTQLLFILFTLLLSLLTTIYLIVWCIV